MRCPILNELPPPPPGKTGWPWTEESPQLPNTRPDGFPWPRISIVTPSFNQGRFLEETIRSVLLQGYPDLEYNIMDGGSTDDSVEIIRKYEKCLTHWVSKPDGGQAAAIAEGFRKTTGELLAYLNSDDLYLPEGLASVALTFVSNKGTNLVYGDRVVINEDGELMYWQVIPKFRRWSLAYGQYLPQECSFWSRNLYEQVGGINDNLKFIMDYDLFYRMAQKSAFVHLSSFVGLYRDHAGTKSRAIFHVRNDEFEAAKKHYGIRKALRFEKRAIIYLFRLVYWWQNVKAMLKGRHISLIKQCREKTPELLSNVKPLDDQGQIMATKCGKRTIVRGGLPRNAKKDRYVLHQFYANEYFEQNPSLDVKDVPGKLANLKCVLDVIRRDKVTSVLEVGCGSGVLLKHVQSYIGAKSAVGCDLSLRHLIEARKYDGCRSGIVQADAQDLPFKSGQFDLVFVADVLEHVSDPVRVLKELKRVAGQVIVLIPIERGWLADLQYFLARRLGKITNYERFGHIHRFNRRNCDALLKKADMIPNMSEVLIQQDEIGGISMIGRLYARTSHAIRRYKYWYVRLFGQAVYVALWGNLKGSTPMETVNRMNEDVCSES